MATSFLITGATGNIGSELIHALFQLPGDPHVIAAVRDLSRARAQFQAYDQLRFRRFDVQQPETHLPALEGVDCLFLLRPPQISRIKRDLRPLLEAAKAVGIQRVVFLSVQGAERSRVIPHNKIEALIQALEMDYVFVRPSYFMQNLTTTLLPEIQQHQTITLPAGKAVFNWIDVCDIGKATARVMLNFEQYRNQALELTGAENKSFPEVAALLREITGHAIHYRSMNPFRFYFQQRNQGLDGGFALVKTLLHALPRLQKPPRITDTYTRITGLPPTRLRAFLEREQAVFRPTADA